METTINEPTKALQVQSEQIERFALFRFQVSLGKGIKNTIKSQGCQWNSLYHGWLCPLMKQDNVQNIVNEFKLDHEIQVVPMPQSMISMNPKISGLQSRLDILEKEVYEQDIQLLEDVYRYNKSLRPSDFAEPKEEEGKSLTQIQIEKDFYERYLSLKKKKSEVEQIKEKLSHLFFRS
jgi:putative DNA primase/helicase